MGFKILHTSDLHIKKDPDDSREENREGGFHYSLHAWKTILGKAIQENVRAILLAGDIFDSYNDLLVMKEKFLEEIPESAPPIYAIPGNHEYLRKPENRHLPDLANGNFHWVFRENFQIFSLPEGPELVLVPYRQSYEKFLEWEIPEKSKPRIVLAHGHLPESAIYTGPSEEEGDHTLDWEMVKRFQPDYVALGHIHKSISVPGLEGCSHVYYPGSPCVWRRGEAGEKKVNLLEMDGNSIQVKVLSLPEVGQYREILVPLAPGGEIPDQALEEIARNPHAARDYVNVIFSGSMDCSKVDLDQKIQAWLRKWKNQFRKLEVDTRKLADWSQISDLPYVHSFLEKWKELQENPTPDIPGNLAKELWEEARILGLQKIYEVVGGN